MESTQFSKLLQHEVDIQNNLKQVDKVTTDILRRSIEGKSVLQRDENNSETDSILKELEHLDQEAIIIQKKAATACANLTTSLLGMNNRYNAIKEKLKDRVKIIAELKKYDKKNCI